MNVLNEYKSRCEWIEKTRKQVEARELQPTVAEHTLRRFMCNPVRSAITYCDIDNESGYSDTGEHEADVNVAKAKYHAAIASLERAISRHREAEKYQTLMDTINELKLVERQLHEATGQLRQTTTKRHNSTGYFSEDEINKRLDSRARYVLNRFADETAFIDHDGNGYRWNYSREQCPWTHFAVFVQLACDDKRGLSLCKANGSCDWKLFKSLFGLTDCEIASAKDGWQKNPAGCVKDLRIAHPGGYIKTLFDRFLKEYDDNRR